MDDDIDLSQVDRASLYDRLSELTDLSDFGEEYLTLRWAQDMFYLLDEGFIEVTADGRYYSTELSRCPNSL